MNASAWQGEYKIYEKTIKGRCSDMRFYVELDGNQLSEISAVKPVNN